MGRLLNALNDIGLTDDTILIVYSDHGQKNLLNQRLPLMIRFPNGEFASRIKDNAQNLDVAPTILDYIGLRIPVWMEGTSLIRREPNPTREIFSTGATQLVLEETGYWSLDQDRVTPPFFQMGFLQVIVCHNWSNLDLETYQWIEGEVSGHTAPCTNEFMPDRKTIQEAMLNLLASDGFDVSALEQALQNPETN